MNFLNRAVGAIKLTTKAHGPTIMVTSGIVSMTAGLVIACRQTLQIEKALEPAVEELEKIDRGLSMKLNGYDDNVARRDRVVVYSRAGFELTKLYAIPGALFLGGAGLVFGGHRIMLQRNATLAIAFTSLKKSFDAYRARVVGSMGPDADQAMLNGWSMKEVIDDESGDTQTIATRDWEKSRQDPYARVFEQGSSTQWQNDLGVNKMFVAHMQQMAQDLLIRQGHLYLSDVYKSLGFPESDISRVCGWKVRILPDGSKDIPFVDFGLNTPMPDDWKYNQENAIFLDFNCVGLIVGGKVQKILEQA